MRSDHYDESRERASGRDCKGLLAEAEEMNVDSRGDRNAMVRCPEFIGAQELQTIYTK